MGRAEVVIFIYCLILVLYLVCMYQFNKPKIRFSDPLPGQSDKQIEKKSVNFDTVNLRKWNLSSSGLYTSKPLQTLETDQKDTVQKENNLPAGINVFKGDQNMTATELAQELERKINADPVDQLSSTVTETCGPEEIKAGGCGDASICKYRTKLPESYESRINQLVLNEKLKIQPGHLKAIQSMSDQFKKRPKLLILTGASSNHYLEIQAMIQYVHENVSHDQNYELIVYDLGLAANERDMMEKFCNCTVLSFPFTAFPEHVKDLKCYGWKAPIVYAHIRHADVVMWADASVRLKSDTKLRHALQRARERGTLQWIGGGPLARFTLVQMFHYFGDEPCVYRTYQEIQATVGFYHNEPFIRQAILAPWVGCSLTRACMCPNKSADIINCFGTGPRWEGPYSNCHRFDQSALSLILTKLYQRASKSYLDSDTSIFDIKREDISSYFDYLNSKLSLQNDINYSTSIITMIVIIVIIVIIIMTRNTK